MSYQKLFFLSAFILLAALGKERLYAQQANQEKHIKVAMRMIGHQILLSSGDSSSLVLPITQKDNQYKITFESDFEFTPLDFNAIIDSVLEVSAIASNYLVEVEDCEMQAVVYSYEVADTSGNDIVPCLPRTQPKACYELYITLVGMDQAVPPANETVSYSSLLVILPLLVLIGIFFYLRSKWRISNSNLNIIPLGSYRFDKRNMKLSRANESVELSSKESDLLYLLYSSANTTLQRDHILNIVWGDDGDYVGRTLDVFISKLRKKLEADSSLKIVNTRGIGYKLVLND